MKVHTIDKITPNFDLIYHACKGILLPKDPREHISHIMVRDNVLHVTDGRALVICNVVDIDNGFYKPTTIKRSHIVLEFRHGLNEVKGDGFNTTYPDVSIITGLDYPDLDGVSTEHESHVCAHIAILTGVPLSDVYTRLASNMGAYRVEFFKGNLKKPVKFMCSTTGCFYVMPIKID